jgi:hypothetical protein
LIEAGTEPEADGSDDSDEKVEGSSEEVAEDEDSGCEESEEEEDDSDGGGWITPSNYKPRPQVQTSPIAVLSTDFAIQVCYWRKFV